MGDLVQWFDQRKSKPTEGLKRIPLFCRRPVKSNGGRRCQPADNTYHTGASHTGSQTLQGVTLIQPERYCTSRHPSG